MKIALRIAFLLPLGSLATFAWGQCNMQIGNFYHQVSCFNANVQVQITGGTPPFTLTFTSTDPSYSQVSYFNGSSSSQSYSHTETTIADTHWSTGPVTVNVTDAMGCQASASHGIAGYWLFGEVNIGVVHDCASGQYRLRLTASWFTSPGGWPVYINGVLLGDVSTAFTNQGSGIWLSNQVYPGATHSVSFGNAGGGDWQCGVGATCCNRYGNPLFIAVPPATTPGACGANFRLRAGLDGPMTTSGLMTDGLRTNNLIPTTEPYTAMGYAYVGSAPGATIQPALLAVTGNDAVVDWVLVEVRHATTLTTVLYSKAALIQRDGDVIDTDGTAYIKTSLTPGAYHVAVKHRNHLGIMTGFTRSLTTDPSPSSALVDLRASGGTYGTNARKQIGSVWCMWGGDVTGNGILAYTGADNDRDPILTAIGGTLPTATLAGQYRREDVNLDGVVKYVGINNDRDPILSNVGGTTPTNTRTQQLP